MSDNDLKQRMSHTSQLVVSPATYRALRDTLTVCKNLTIGDFEAWHIATFLRWMNST